ncbi:MULTISPECIES: hypothetical protein [unclassified Oceanobacillus]|uniref:hypothetical protein n=1 Tax=unclassified Oceanobacillus TaxID=2630292 RepID=UPI00300E3557
MLSETSGNKKIHQFKQKLVTLEKRIEEIDHIIMKLFEQNALGKVTDERFSKMSLTYESEQKEVTQRYKELQSKVNTEEKKTPSTNKFMEPIRKYETVTELKKNESNG